VDEIFKRFRAVGRPVINLVIAEFFLQLLNAAFFLILLIYMDKKGYPDTAAAGFISYRFLGVLLTAIPFGLLIKGLPLRPFFIASSIMTPILSWLVIHFISAHNETMVSVMLLLWGVSFNFFQVGVLPYIIRNVQAENQTEAITMNFATWSLSSILSGSIIYLLRTVNVNFFSEELLLKMFCLLSAIGIFFAFGITRSEVIIKDGRNRFDLRQFDWFTIAKALAPTFLIALGAGLTIPFVSLFFYNIHGVDSGGFSLIGAFANLVVFAVAFFIPSIKSKFGFRKAVPFTQGAAVVMLVLLASTEWYAQFSIAIWLAVLFYIADSL